MLFEIAKYAAALVTIGTALGLVVKWIIVKPIKTYIDHATYPIQKTSNGGYALPDAIKTLDRIETKLDDVDNRLIQVESHITNPPTRTRKSTK